MRNLTLRLTIQNDELESLSELVTAIRSLTNVGAVEVAELSTSGESLERDLERLLNQHSVENGSNTPDYVLASLLKATLDTWELHMKERDRWWGNRSILGPGNSHPAVSSSDETLLSR
jgi:hypothetical protein